MCYSDGIRMTSLERLTFIVQTIQPIQMAAHFNRYPRASRPPQCLQFRRILFWTHLLTYSEFIISAWGMTVHWQSAKVSSPSRMLEFRSRILHLTDKITSLWWVEQESSEISFKASPNRCVTARSFCMDCIVQAVIHHMDMLRKPNHNCGFNWKRTCNNI